MTASLFTFEPEVAVVGRFRGTVTPVQMADEVGVQGATPDFVREHCGALANSVLDRVPSGFYDGCAARGLYPVIDVRVHRLSPGDLPAFPGWHCDGVYRETYRTVMDLTALPHRTALLGTISTDPDGVSVTEFMADPFTAEVTDPGEADPLWAQVDRAAEAARDRVTVRTGRDGALIEFGSHTLHRATPARTDGWRLFFRMSMWDRPCLDDGGRFTQQERVYQTSWATAAEPVPNLPHPGQVYEVDPDPLLRIN